MKVKRLIISMLFAMGLLACAEVEETTISTEKSHSVETIDEAALEKLEEEVVILQNEDFVTQIPDGGAELKGVFLGDEIQSIEVFYGLSYGLTERKFTFENGLLAKVEEVEKTFPYNTEEDMMDYDNPKIVFEAVYNFSEGEFTDSKSEGTREFSNPPVLDANHVQDDFEKEVKGFLEMLIKNRK